MDATTASTMGERVLGPIVAEFCLRLWELANQLDHPEDAAMLFCARGGLRMQLCYEHFLAASGLRSPVPLNSFMVSRAAAIRPSLAASIARGDTTPQPAAAAALSYEFSSISLSDAVKALSGCSVQQAEGFDWTAPTTPSGLLEALARPEAAEASAVILDQAALFSRHFEQLIGDRRFALLVDTGLFGTTGQLMAEGFPEHRVATALLGRSYRPLRGAPEVPAIGLSVSSRAYAAMYPRTTVLRYWHFVEWLFEPELPSVRSFREVDGSVVSNLEVDGWSERIQPTPGTALAGVVAYLDALPAAAAERIVADAPAAWRRFHRAVVWPRRTDAEALRMGLRAHDFGRDETFGERSWAGPIAVLRGSPPWREGEIARSGTPLRVPLLALIELGYFVRNSLTTLRSRH